MQGSKVDPRYIPKRADLGTSTNLKQPDLGVPVKHVEFLQYNEQVQEKIKAYDDPKILVATPAHKDNWPFMEGWVKYPLYEKLMGWNLEGLLVFNNWPNVTQDFRRVLSKNVRETLKKSNCKIATIDTEIKTGPTRDEQREALATCYQMIFDYAKENEFLFVYLLDTDVAPITTDMRYYSTTGRLLLAHSGTEGMNVGAAGGIVHMKGRGVLGESYISSRLGENNIVGQKQVEDPNCQKIEVESVGFGMCMLAYHAFTKYKVPRPEECRRLGVPGVDFGFGLTMLKDGLKNILLKDVRGYHLKYDQRHKTITAF